MSTGDVIAIILGVVAIGAVNWWFFVAGGTGAGGGHGSDATPR